MCQPCLRQTPYIIPFTERCKMQGVEQILDKIGFFFFLSAVGRYADGGFKPFGNFVGECRGFCVCHGATGGCAVKDRA